MTEQSACPRCGTFAPLVTTQWRTLCAPCIELVRHPLEQLNPGVGAILGGTFCLLRQTWTFVLPVALLAAIPHCAIAWAERPPWWFGVGYSVVVGTFAEGLVVSYAGGHALSGRGSLAAALKRVEKRYFAILGVNAISSVAMNVGILVCVPGILFGTWLLSAIPIALFEGANPLVAVRDSFRRTAGFRLVLFFVVAVSMTPMFFLSLVDGLSEVLPRAIFVGEVPQSRLGGVRVGTILVLSVVHVYSQLLQISAWLLTRKKVEAVAEVAAMNVAQ